MSAARRLVANALFLALGLVLPILFHLIGASGAIFLPMHIPVLLCGLVLGWRSGLCVGVLTPLLSALLTGMPPLMPVAPMMAVELALYGVGGGYFYTVRRWPLLLSLLGAMVLGRIGTVLVVTLFAGMLRITMSPLVYVAMAAMQGAIGIAIQFIFIPICMKSIQHIYITRGEKR